jgi:hypothetical protein
LAASSFLGLARLRGLLRQPPHHRVGGRRGIVGPDFDTCAFNYFDGMDRNINSYPLPAETFGCLDRVACL